MNLVLSWLSNVFLIAVRIHGMSEDVNIQWLSTYVRCRHHRDCNFSNLCRLAWNPCSQDDDENVLLRRDKVIRSNFDREVDIFSKVNEELDASC